MKLYIVTLQLWEGRKATTCKRSFATVAASMEKAIAFVLHQWTKINEPSGEFRWMSSEAVLLDYDLILPAHKGMLVSFTDDE